MCLAVQATFAKMQLEAAAEAAQAQAAADAAEAAEGEQPILEAAGAGGGDTGAAERLAAASLEVRPPPASPHTFSQYLYYTSGHADHVASTTKQPGHWFWQHAHGALCLPG